VNEQNGRFGSPSHAACGAPHPARAARRVGVIGAGCFGRDDIVVHRRSASYRGRAKRVNTRTSSALERVSH
jgi:hypothetical protein